MMRAGFMERAALMASGGVSMGKQLALEGLDPALASRFSDFSARLRAQEVEVICAAQIQSIVAVSQLEPDIARLEAMNRVYGASEERLAQITRLRREQRSAAAEANAAFGPAREALARRYANMGEIFDGLKAGEERLAEVEARMEMEVELAKAHRDTWREGGIRAPASLESVEAYNQRLAEIEERHAPEIEAARAPAPGRRM